MKIRILNNSLRLRLTQSEVLEIGHHNEVSAKIQFSLAPPSALTYAVCSADVEEITANYETNTIAITIPKHLAQELAETDLVSLTHDQTLDENQTLKILIEKDFQCLKPRQGEDDIDA
ncbi:MAG: hypothetical protein VYA34_16965, partial [Myxococcota bacterium]|nr:hypothetical protein [Myxococcota bacterium]